MSKHEAAGKVHFWTTFVGFHLTFLVERWPRHNFTWIPRVHSERPAFDLHCPQFVARLERSTR